VISLPRRINPLRSIYDTPTKSSFILFEFENCQAAHFDIGLEPEFFNGSLCLAEDHCKFYLFEHMISHQVQFFLFIVFLY
jgi:hypothetical protein